jgi:hypothetical protein
MIALIKLIFGLLGGLVGLVLGLLGGLFGLVVGLLGSVFGLLVAGFVLALLAVPVILFLALVF